MAKNAISKDVTWSIGIYGGHSPFHLAPLEGVTNPVLTCRDVSGIPAKFVADPFMVQVDGIWHMFFEVLNQQTNKGEIGLAKSRTGRNWIYQQIVLTEPYHLSYPYVFEFKGDYYMTPETLAADAVCLYQAVEFPLRWSFVDCLVKGSCADPSVFRFDGRWWMFTCSTPYQHDTLRLYLAEDIRGPWREHPASPIVQSNKRQARPAGRVLVLDGRIIRFAQDCIPIYGARLRAFEAFQLTTSSYSEKENQHSPVLTASGQGWNGLGMHHVDAHPMNDGQWIACVDGSSGTDFSL